MSEIYSREQNDIYGLNQEQIAEALELYTNKIKDDIYNEIELEYGITKESMTESVGVYNLMDLYIDKAITKGMEMVADSYIVIDYYKEYLKTKNIESELEYGWLYPNGNFKKVKFGYHLEFADTIIELNDWNKEINEFVNNKPINGYSSDFLVYKKGFILLHNPSQGMAFPTYNESKSMTKAQKEFLFDYYLKRDRKDLANKYFE